MVQLPATAPDLAVARSAARHATRPMQRTLQMVTWLGDEKVVLTGAALFWIYCRFGRHDHNANRCADQIVLGTGISAALPHLIKHLVDRERPDRKVVHGRRHGIPRSGQRWDSFPSGHAVLVGALATALKRYVPARLRPLVWPTAISLAATRIMLLAHYPTDVAAGLVLGSGVDRGVRKLLHEIDRRKWRA
jgi:membrane-associated phospholipid phosphatase